MLELCVIGKQRGVAVVFKVKQHSEILGGADHAAATDQRRHETFTELPLGGLVKTCAQVVQDRVKFVKIGWLEDVGGSHGRVINRCWREVRCHVVGV